MPVLTTYNMSHGPVPAISSKERKGMKEAAEKWDRIQHALLLIPHPSHSLSAPLHPYCPVSSFLPCPHLAVILPAPAGVGSSSDKFEVLSLMHNYSLT